MRKTFRVKAKPSQLVMKLQFKPKPPRQDHYLTAISDRDMNYHQDYSVSFGDTGRHSHITVQLFNGELKVFANLATGYGQEVETKCLSFDEVVRRLKD